MKIQYDELEQMADLLKVLGHPVRLCIVRGLLKQSCNVTKIQECIGLPQSTISQHLGVLRSMGIIQGKRRGIEIIYSLVSEDAKRIAGLLTTDCDDEVDDFSWV